MNYKKKNEKRKKKNEGIKAGFAKRERKSLGLRDTEDYKEELI